MLETTVANGAKQLGLQQKVAETGRVNTNVAALLVDVAVGSELALLAGGGGGGLVGANLLVGVVNEILLVRHVGRGSFCEKFVRLKKRSVELKESWPVSGLSRGMNQLAKKKTSFQTESMRFGRSLKKRGPNKARFTWLRGKKEYQCTDDKSVRAKSRNRRGDDSASFQAAVQR